ncbi:MAG: DUF393 domain-containing protein [Candidatus Zixiibacteriota bacterium]
MMPIPSRPSIWILWDGECAFCRRWVEWVETRDRSSSLRAVPYQHAGCDGSPPLTPELYRRCRRAVHVMMPDGTTIGGGAAVACILGQIGFPRLGRFLSWRPILPLTEFCYRLVARNRRFLSRWPFPRSTRQERDSGTVRP